jgi:hypothetical protein
MVNAAAKSVRSYGALYLMLQNRVYLEGSAHKGQSYTGQQPAVIDQD